MSLRLVFLYPSNLQIFKIISFKFNLIFFIWGLIFQFSHWAYRTSGSAPGTPLIWAVMDSTPTWTVKWCTIHNFPRNKSKVFGTQFIKKGIIHKSQNREAPFIISLKILSKIRVNLGLIQNIHTRSENLLYTYKII